MANPRQRRKARSSTHKPVSHSRHAKRNLKKTPPIRAPKALQDAWDDKKTVKQNYAALGLIHSLNPNMSGGEERPSTQNVQQESSTSTIAQSSVSSIPRGFGKIIRDANGNVLSLEIPEETENNDGVSEQARMDEGPEPLQAQDENLVAKWVTNLGGEREGAASSMVVQSLERISSSKHNSTTLSAALSGAGPRHASSGEVLLLERLVQKHGNNLERMSMDIKLNPQQRTVSELKRAFKRAGIDVGDMPG